MFDANPTTDTTETNLNPFSPPTVDQPTFTPPVANPFATFEPAPAAPNFAPAPAPPLFPDKPKQVFTKFRVTVLVAAVAIGILTIGTVSQAAKADRLDKQLAKANSDLSMERTEVGRLNGKVSGLEGTVTGLNSTVSRLQSDNSDLEGQNDNLAEFGVRVSSLVDDLDACVDGTQQFIMDLGTNPYAWTTGRIRSLVQGCEQAQAEAADLDAFLTS